MKTAELTLDEAIQQAREWQENSDVAIPAEIVTGLVDGAIELRVRCNALEVERDKLREALGNFAFSYDARDAGDGCWCSEDGYKTFFERTGEHEGWCLTAREAYYAEGEEEKKLV